MTEPDSLWEQIARLLKAERLSDREISRRLRVGSERVAKVRADLGLPAFWYGCVPAWTPERFAGMTDRLPGGHRIWKGKTHKTGTPVIGSESAYRTAFRLHFGRDPVGKVTRTCRVSWCVEGSHQQDRVMRDEARGAAEALTELPVGATYLGMDLVAIRRALDPRSLPPYPPLRLEERKFAARFADPDMDTETLARRLGSCAASAKTWREPGAAS